MAVEFLVGDRAYVVRSGYVFVANVVAVGPEKVALEHSGSQSVELRQQVGKGSPPQRPVGESDLLYAERCVKAIGRQHRDDAMANLAELVRLADEILEKVARGEPCHEEADAYRAKREGVTL